MSTELNIILMMSVFALIIFISVRVFIITKHQSLVLIAFGCIILIVKNSLWILRTAMLNSSNENLADFFHNYYIYDRYLEFMQWLLLGVGFSWLLESHRKLYIANQNNLYKQVDNQNNNTSEDG